MPNITYIDIIKKPDLCSWKHSGKDNNVTKVVKIPQLNDDIIGILIQDFGFLSGWWNSGIVGNMNVAV